MLVCFCLDCEHVCKAENVLTPVNFVNFDHALTY